MNPDEAVNWEDQPQRQPAAADNNLLDVSLRPHCTHQELKHTYRRLARQLHPDHGGNAADFQRLQREYEAALSRVAGRRSTRSLTWSPPACSVHRPLPLWAFAAAIVLAAAVIGLGWTLDGSERVLLFGLIASFLILLGLPLLLSACRPAVAAVVLVAVFVAAGSVLSSLLLSGALQEALHPIDVDQRHAFRHHATIVVTLLSAVLLVSSVLGFLFSASDHDF